MASMKDKIAMCLEQQISEYELLKSMYPDNGEIVLFDGNILNDMKRFVENSLETEEHTPSHLSFTINLKLQNLKLEVCVDLPTFYPEEEPDLYIRSNQLNRQQETNLNDSLYQYLRSNSLDSGEVVLFTAICWLQDHIEDFKTDSMPVTINAEPELSESKFVRMWIYSHHIYNKKKREEIVSRARHLGLTGFSLPGKPGIICIEGAEAEAKLWWKDIKSMTWKKISLRKIEEFSDSEQKEQQKFYTFDELHFPNSSSSKNSKHADMSGFSKHMEKYGLGTAFNDFFGLCND